MDITEQTSSRLVVKSPISRGAAWSGGLMGLFAVILLTNVVNIEEGDHFLWHTVVPLLGAVYALFCLAPLHTSILTIDKSTGAITRKNSYIFGITASKSVQLSSVKQFTIRHIRTLQWNPAQIQFGFHSNKTKLIFESDRLHFEEGTNKYDPSKAQEEGLGQYIAEFIGVAVTVNDRMIDSKDIKTRFIAIVVLFAAGVVVGYIIL